MELLANPCLCKAGNDRILFPQRMGPSALTAYAFSARRRRSLQHYRIVRCRACGLVRSDPVLSDRDLGALYRASQFLYAQESAYAARTYASLVSRQARAFHGTGPIRLLEIGCGDGSFLKEMGRRGLKGAVGVEPSVQALGHASPEVRPTIVNDLFRRGLFQEGTFDVVCAFHLLDHLARPDALLEECFRILDGQGLLILVCHNVDAFVNRILGERSPVFDIEHIFLFNPATLGRLAVSSGFALREQGRVVNTYPLSYWLRYAPVLSRIADRLPLGIGNVPFTLNAGNIYLCAQKR